MESAKKFIWHVISYCSSLPAFFSFFATKEKKRKKDKSVGQRDIIMYWWSLPFSLSNCVCVCCMCLWLLLVLKVCGTVLEIILDVICFLSGFATRIKRDYFQGQTILRGSWKIVGRRRGTQRNGQLENGYRGIDWNIKRKSRNINPLKLLFSSLFIYVIVLFYFVLLCFVFFYWRLK